MTALSAPIDLIQPATTSLNPAAHVSRAKIDASSKQFESQFLSVMFGQMFEGTEVSAPFGGGEGEAAFKSFLTDAMAKSVVKSGGIGLAKDIAKEMLKMQGLSPEPTAAPAASSGLAIGAYGAAGQLSPLRSGRPAKAQTQTTSTKQ